MHLFKRYLDICSWVTTCLVPVMDKMAQDGRGSALLSLRPAGDTDLSHVLDETKVINQLLFKESKNQQWREIELKGNTHIWHDIQPSRD